MIVPENSNPGIKGLVLVFALDLENVEEVERDRCGGD